MRIVVLNGVNLDVVGRRDPELYGGLGLSELETRIYEWALEFQCTVRCRQTNHEGELIDWCHDAFDWADGVIINPGAWSHYSYAIRDAVELFTVPVVEVHLSNILEREDWPAESAGRVMLASNEALTNAIEHGSRDGGLVEVELVVTYERADIRIVDEGIPGAAIPRLPSDPPPITAERGRGLIIISRLADDFDMAPVGDGTQVRVGFLRDERDEVQTAGARAAA